MASNWLHCQRLHLRRGRWRVLGGSRQDGERAHGETPSGQAREGLRKDGRGRWSSGGGSATL